MRKDMTEVFIASRFDEFAALRACLQRKISQTKHMLPVDLNDGRARHRPPLAECLARVQNAELMVLLLGETYGPAAPNQSKSFTHLEYDEANRDGSKTRMLAYRVKRSSPPPTAGDAIPGTWLREIEEMHTLAWLDGNQEPSTLADQIMVDVLLCFHELHFGEVSEVDSSDDLDSFDLPDVRDDLFDDSEVDSLEAIEAMARGGEDDSARGTGADPDFAARNPAATAALEQRAEAERAISLREFGVAVQHLQRALALRPLDGPANFWLARLYVVLGRRDRYGQAANLAERAARIARDAGMPYRAAVAYSLSGRALAELGDMAGAHAAVDRALEQRPDFAKAYLERARVFCKEGKLADAVATVHEAFERHSSSLYLALRDPHLRSIRRQLRELLKVVTSRWLGEVQRLLDNERTLASLARASVPDVSASEAATQGLHKLREVGQLSILRQHALVQKLVAEADSARRNSSPELRTSTAAELTGRRHRLSLELASALREESEATQEHGRTLALPSLVDASVWLPPVLAIAAAAWSPWFALTIVVLSAGALLTARNFLRSRARLALAQERLSAAASHLRASAARRAQLEDRIATADAELAELKTLSADARASAAQALRAFESGAVAMPPRYQPFDTLRRAQAGRLVRVSVRAIGRFEADYGRQVERDDDFWLDEQGRASDFALYRVSAAKRGGLRLSRADAYAAEYTRDVA